MHDIAYLQYSKPELESLVDTFNAALDVLMGIKHLCMLNYGLGNQHQTPFSHCADRVQCAIWCASIILDHFRYLIGADSLECKMSKIWNVQDIQLMYVLGPERGHMKHLQ